jgi:hypothetical protein
MKIIISIFAITLLLAGCGETKAPKDHPYKTGQQTGRHPPAHDAAHCAKLMAKMRALRDGPQPCVKGANDCWVFHNGEHWDGCPVEVNKTNNAILEKMRAEIERLRCPVDKGANCAPQEIMECVAGGCGGKAPPRGASPQ